MDTHHASFDLITLEVVRNKLVGIANEMEMTLLQSSFSSIAKECMDASASLFDVKGETLSQATAVPIHLATLITVVEHVLKRHPVDTMQEGDIYLLNDPYCGGTHLPDFAVVVPVFHGDRPVALSATMTHHQDVGGMVPGSVPTNATEVFQEGIRIPILKLRDRGVWNDTLLEILRLNVRMPDVFIGDLNAQISACSIGARRVRELAALHGGSVLMAMFAELLTRSETMTRRAIARLPQGTFRYVDHLDNDGVDLDRLVRMEVAVTVAGDSITVDFTGTSPQVRGPVNCVPSGAMAAACYAIRALTDPAIPTNGGCFRPLRLILPPGSLVNPRPPAPVGTRTSTIKLATASIIGAFRAPMQGRLPASDAVDMHGVSWGGRRADGSAYVISESIGSGTGARPNGDGYDVVDSDVSNVMNLPVEAIEMDTPIRLNRTEIRPDSGGDGRWRGGLGIVREYEVLDGDVVLTHRGDRARTQAPGFAGGRPGAASRSVIIRADGRVETIPSRQVVVLSKGDRLVVETAGGGGYGEPAGRPAQAVKDDVANRKISAAHAKAAYGVDVLS